MDVQPNDRILEVGCGPGVAAAEICGLIDGGSLTAIDRSGTAIERAAQRNTGHIESGRLELHQTDLAGFDPRSDRFDKAFAVNVNVFWTRDTSDEIATLAEALRNDAMVWMIYEAPSRGQVRDVGPRIAAKLERHEFATELISGSGGSLLCVTGRRL